MTADRQTNLLCYQNYVFSSEFSRDIKGVIYYFILRYTFNLLCKSFVKCKNVFYTIYTNVYIWMYMNIYMNFINNVYEFILRLLEKILCLYSMNMSSMKEFWTYYICHIVTFMSHTKRQLRWQLHWQTIYQILCLLYTV